MSRRFENALSPVALRQLYQMMTQMRSTGRVITPKDMEAMYRSVMQAEVANSLQNRQLQQQRDMNIQNLRMQQRAYDDRQSGNTMAGLGMLGSLAFQGLKPNAQGVTPIGSMFGMVKKPFTGIGDLFSKEPVSPQAPSAPFDVGSMAPTPMPDMTDAVGSAAESLGSTIPDFATNLTDNMLYSGANAMAGAGGNALAGDTWDATSELVNGLFSGLGGLFK
jgi:hypothetical protein